MDIFLKCQNKEELFHLENNIMKIEMKIIYIILNVYNFSQINLSKLRDTF